MIENRSILRGNFNQTGKKLLFWFLLVYNYNLRYSYYFLLYLNINKPHDPEMFKIHFFIQQDTHGNYSVTGRFLPQNRNFQFLAFAMIDVSGP